MKKIIYILIAFVLLVSSCSTNENQKSVIDPDNVGTVSDISKLADYLKIYVRSLSSGSSIYYTEIAADYFNPGLGYGNRNGMWYRWEWSSESQVGIFSTCYAGINQACYVIELANKLDAEELTDDEKKTIDESLALAYFAKAFLGSKLIQYYCDNYTSSNIDKNAEGTGIIIIDEYNPTPNQDEYKGRASLEDSYTWVFTNLQEAKNLLPVTSQVGSIVPTKDACDALRARLLLAMGNYNEAAPLAASLADNGKYPLIESETDWTNLWSNDSGAECIYQCFAEYSASLPNSYDPGYISYSASTRQYTPDWIPSEWLLSIYSGTDFRKSWFTQRTVTFTPNIANVTLLTKFPGNKALQASYSDAQQSDYLQKPKPFRIAEQYLIAAEAYAMSGATTLANQYLDALKSKRDPSYTAQTLSGDALIAAIRQERALELIGEGFRFFDLKRYGEGMTRTGVQDKLVINMQAGNKGQDVISIAANDYRWVQPIPQSEIDANPAIRNQQNRGYQSESNN